MQRPLPALSPAVPGDAREGDTEQSRAGNREFPRRPRGRAREPLPDVGGGSAAVTRGGGLCRVPAGRRFIQKARSCAAARGLVEPGSGAAGAAGKEGARSSPGAAPRPAGGIGPERRPLPPRAPEQVRRPRTPQPLCAPRRPPPHPGPEAPRPDPRVTAGSARAAGQQRRDSLVKEPAGPETPRPGTLGPRPGPGAATWGVRTVSVGDWG